MPNIFLIERFLHRILIREATQDAPTLKRKLGIRQDWIPDDRFELIQKIVPAGNNSMLTGAVKFYPEVKSEFPAFLQYLRRLVVVNPKADLHKFTDFASLEHYVDAQEARRNKTQGTQGLASNALEAQEPDWESADGRYRLYTAPDQQSCIKYGQGYTFCIARKDDQNRYHYYRKKGCSFYYLFDLKLPSTAETYITVIGAYPDDTFEFTHKENNTADATRRYDSSLQKFMQTKPGLRGLESVVVPVAHTEAESDNYESVAQVNRIVTSYEEGHGPTEEDAVAAFKKLSHEQRSLYLQNSYHLPVAIYHVLSPDLKILSIKNRVDFYIACLHYEYHPSPQDAQIIGKALLELMKTEGFYPLQEHNVLEPFKDAGLWPIYAQAAVRAGVVGDKMIGTFTRLNNNEVLKHITEAAEKQGVHLELSLSSIFYIIMIGFAQAEDKNGLITHLINKQTLKISDDEIKYPEFLRDERVTLLTRITLAGANNLYLEKSQPLRDQWVLMTKYRDQCKVGIDYARRLAQLLSTRPQDQKPLLVLIKKTKEFLQPEEIAQLDKSVAFNLDKAKAASAA